ncbi:MAG TPA: serine/threonine-protein kinase [Polyangiaceae bacterium]|nr:serine/threonine-protein kinase [Polyangiaceae bacterium]
MASAQQPHQQQRYRVIERIAAGGMAEVFRAESAGLEGFKKKVAIKRVLPHLTEKREFINMFLDEARLSAHLGHSNCVQVFDIGKGDNAYFIVMEYVDGSDLKGVLEYQRQVGGLFPVEEACLICVRICEGLAYAHELRDEENKPLHIVHRDMSPPNVLLTRHGEVKIVDFGLAKANSQLEQSQPGIIKGKFGYLSPEAAQGKEVDARTDLFAVGIILWELLAGRRLFQGKTDLETVRQVQRAEVPDLRQYNPLVSDSVMAVLARGLAADPNERFQTAREFGHALNDVMFALPRAVSSFELAKLVEPVQAARAQEKKRKAIQGSFIGTLIDQALFEFTSLQSSNESNSPLGSGAEIPLDVHSFVGAMPGGSSPNQLPDWAASLSSASIPRPEEQGFDFGNLSALEDEKAYRAPSRAPSAPPPARKGRGGAIAVGAILLVLLGLGGAYLGGVLPPRVTRSLGLP